MFAVIKMNFESVCNLCLTMDIPIRALKGGPLQDVYMKLTNNSYSTAVTPVAACYLCYSQLRKCHNLMVMSVRAGEVLKRIQTSEMIQEEFKAMIKVEARQLVNTLNITPVEVLSIVDADQQLTEVNFKEDPLSQCKEEVEIESGVCVKFEELEDVPAELENREDIDDEGWTLEDNNEEDLKAVYIEKMKYEDAALAPVKKKHTQTLAANADKIDKTTMTLCRNNKSQKYSRLTKPRTGKPVITEERSDRSITFTKTSDKVDKKRQIAYIDIAMNEDYVSYNSNNDWTSAIDVSNGEYDYLKKINICNGRDDIVHNKYLEIDRNTEEKCERINGDNSPHENIELLKESLKKTDVMNESTKRVENNFECKICHKKMSGKVKVKAHLKTHADAKPFMCEICALRFNTQTQLTTHLRTHSGERPFECDICQLKFVQKKTLRNHINIHNGQKIFQCDICPQSFRSRSGIYKHITRHSGQEPFKCIICPQTYYAKYQMVVHLRTHTLERPYECTICQKSFSAKINLKKHLTRHAGVKPYECKQCQRRFGTSNHLKLHFRTHTGDRPFECDVCQARFARKDNLTAHLRIHTGEKPFECEICKRRFNQGSSLKTHLRIHSK